MHDLARTAARSEPLRASSARQCRHARARRLGTTVLLLGGNLASRCRHRPGRSTLHRRTTKDPPRAPSNRGARPRRSGQATRNPRGTLAAAMRMLSAAMLKV